MASLDRRLTLLGKIWTVQAKSWWWILTDWTRRNGKRMRMKFWFFVIVLFVCFSHSRTAWLSLNVFSKSFVCIYASQSNLYVQILVPLGPQACVFSLSFSLSPKFNVWLCCFWLILFSVRKSENNVQEGWMRFSDSLLLLVYRRILFKCFLLLLLYFLCSALLWNATSLCFYFDYSTAIKQRASWLHFMKFLVCHYYRPRNEMCHI